VDPFIDRTFGHNFDSSREWDRDYVDRIEARDRAEIRCGRIKPTHVVAAMCSGRPGKNIVMDGLTPQFSVRHPSHRPRPLGSSRKVDATDVALPESHEAGHAPAALVDEREIEIRVSPAVPQCGDYMVARISVTGASPVFTQDRARADAIAIEVKAQGTLHIAAAETALELGLGQFAAGEVQLSARMAGLTTEKTVGVSARAPRHGITMPLLDYSDLWWNPSEPGWGVSIHQHPNGQLVAFWLGYDDACNPTWLSLHPGGWVSERVFEGPVYRHRGPGGAKPYDPSGVVAMVAGTGSLTFRTWKAATLRWELADGRLVKDIDRMDF
jgi:hypothetical protein